MLRHFTHTHQRMHCLRERARADDMVWLHDYHLMVLPAMLRKRMPNN
ncbi:hypothetical protein EON62_06225, partial [archaeon]